MLSVRLGPLGHPHPRSLPCPHFSGELMPRTTGRLRPSPNGLCHFRSVACPLLFPIAERNNSVRRVGMLARDRILVVDDNESVRTILAESLEYEGFRVSTAADGQHAWELLQHTPFSYDLVLT